MISYLIYSHFEAFIEDDDDVVSWWAQVQLVLVYFAALAIYAADGQDEKQGVFSGAAFGVVLLLIFFISFVIGACVTLLEYFGYSSLRSVFTDLCTWNSSFAQREAPGQSGGDAVEVTSSVRHDGGRSAPEDSGDAVHSVDSPHSDASTGVRDNKDSDVIDLYVGEDPSSPQPNRKSGTNIVTPVLFSMTEDEEDSRDPGHA